MSSKGLRAAFLSAPISLLAAGMVCSSHPDGPPCREERQFSGSQYWFWEGYLGVTDVTDIDSERKGRLSNDPAICFRVPLTELDDHLARTRGYKESIVQWLERLPQEAGEWGKDAQPARQKIRVLTGRDFSSLAEFQRWWEENNDYLLWSENAKQMVVDEQAKRTEVAIAPLESVYDITPERYWLFEGMGWLGNITENGDHLMARAWSGDREISVRVMKAALADRESKEKGYRSAVMDIIENRLMLTELGDESLKSLLPRLRELTGENFADRQSWIDWWNINKDSLVLSENGRHLVVRRR